MEIMKKNTSSKRDQAFGESLSAFRDQKWITKILQSCRFAWLISKPWVVADG